ncbi:hypothetical protein J6K35_03570, partial [bacterium]|nr:hypothetical protein [bacterium]
MKKTKLAEAAKDLKLENQELIDLLEKRDSVKRKNTTALSEEELNYILNDSKKLNRVIVSDLKFISNKYGVERKTEIIEANKDFSIDKRDLILKEDV